MHNVERRGASGAEKEAEKNGTAAVSGVVLGGGGGFVSAYLGRWSAGRGIPRVENLEFL